MNDEVGRGSEKHAGIKRVEDALAKLQRGEMSRTAFFTIYLEERTNHLKELSQASKGEFGFLFHGLIEECAADIREIASMELS